MTSCLSAFFTPQALDSVSIRDDLQMDQVSSIDKASRSMPVWVFPSCSPKFCLVYSSLSTLKLILSSGLCLALLFLHIFCFRVIVTGLMFGIAPAFVVFRLSFALVKMKSI